MSEIVQFEIYADDLNRAKRFYENVFAWELNKIKDSDTFWLINTWKGEKHNIIGRLVKRLIPIDGNSVIAFLCTIDVSDIDVSINLINKYGGSIVIPKRIIPELGFQAYCKDSEGNIFGIIKLNSEVK